MNTHNYSELTSLNSESKTIMSGMSICSKIDQHDAHSKYPSTDAGVPVVPGYHGNNQDPEYLLKEAKQIGTFDLNTTLEFRFIPFFKGFRS